MVRWVEESGWSGGDDWGCGWAVCNLRGEFGRGSVRGREMVARVEDCFLGKEPGLRTASHRWRWSPGERESGDSLPSGNAFGDGARSGALLLPTWTSGLTGASGVGFAKGLHNVQGAGAAHPGGRVQPHPARHTDLNVDSGILTSFVSSYLMQQQQSQAGTAAAAATGRAGAVVTSTTALAPGAAASLARNPSFESISNTGSCSTPSFCVGSPVTVFPSRPSDSGSHKLLPSSAAAAAFSESRVVLTQSQLSDRYLSNDSLSYGSMEERDAIVNCVDDFWTGEPVQLPEFRFEPMLDDTADTGGCALAFELDPLVSSNHGPRGVSRAAAAAGLSSMIAPAPDFCQTLFAGMEEAEQKPLAVPSKPTHLSIPARGALFNASSDHPRLRWTDEPWSRTSPQFPNPPSEKSPTGSSPSSPTTPLDPHLFASSKLTEFSGATSNNKRSFATMQSGSEKPETASLALPLRLHGGGGAANADKFDAAALSALLYSNNQSNQEFRSAYSTTTTTSPTQAPAPKQRRRHGTATDPQSIAARTRREKFTDRIRVLQTLVPNGERLDTVHMLSQTFEYVRFLQHKVWDLYNGKDSLADVKCEKWKEFVDTTTGQVIV